MIHELPVAFVIMAICLVIHVTGIVALGEALVAKRAWVEGLGWRGDGIVLALVSLIIIILHLIEATVWAAFYYERSLFPTFETALYFSLTSYTTIGYGDVVMPQHWRLLGGIEGLSGVLLCGLSTAFVFAVLNILFQTRIERRAAKNLPTVE